MPWSFRAAASATNSSYAEATIVINKPTGTVSGDLLFSAIVSDFANISTAPSGWTLIRNTSAATGNRLITYYKVAGGSEPSTYTWTFDANTDISGGIIAYSGLTGTPLDVENGQENSSASTSVTAPAVTVTNSDSLLIFAGGVNEDNDATTYTAPSGMTERVDTFNTWSSLEIADQNVASGSTGTRVATASNSHESIGHLAAFIQTAAGGVRSLSLLGVGQ